MSLNTYNDNDQRLSKWYFRPLSITGLLIVIFSLSIYHGNLRKISAWPAPRHIVALPLPEASKTELPSGLLKDDSYKEQASWHRVTVRRGDNLSRIFGRLGLPNEDLYTLIACCEEAKSLHQLHPGQTIKMRRDNNNNLKELVYEPSSQRKLRLIRQHNTFVPANTLQTLEKRTAFISGTVDHSLYRSALRVGLSDRLIRQFVEIFSWEIDMALDIHPGDGFTVIYEEYYRKGEKIRNGNILAAELTHRGKNYQAVRYTDKTGHAHYYTPQGRSMRQTFLRSPVDFRRISSHFQPERWHPVLGVKRPHRGVDYAAPIGTPVWASGDGQVSFIGHQSGYGKVIILQHGKRYTTLYGHLSRFHKGLQKGSQIKQGQIIGFVGQTGLATGPHLHYEFRIDGKHVDPVTAKLPRSLPMNSQQQTDFRKQTASLIAQLDIHKRTRLALLNAR